MYDGGGIVGYAGAERHKRGVVGIARARHTSASLTGPISRNQLSPLICECLVFPSPDCWNDLLSDYGWANVVRLHGGNALGRAGGSDHDEFDPFSRHPGLDAGDPPELVEHFVGPGPATDQIRHDDDRTDR